MAVTKYLDKTGLTYFWSKIKAWCNATFAAISHTHSKLVSSGDNVASTSTNTYASGLFNVRWFNATGKVPEQPSQYGFLATFATGDNASEVHQLWCTQANGDLYHRGTNGNSYTSPPAFKKIIDSSNETQLSLTTSGSGNAVTALSVSNHAITATKGTTFLTSHQSLDGKMTRGSYERIEGTSSAHKDLNSYTIAGFYNVKTQYVDNCPSGIGIDAVLLVYPWNGGTYCTQELTESAASSDVRRWIRKYDQSIWTDWKQLAFQSSIPSLTNYVTLNSAQTISAVKTFTAKPVLNQVGLDMTVKDTNANTLRTYQVLHANSDNTGYGLNVAFGGSGNTVVGSGESHTAQLSALAGDASENLYLVADGHIYFKTNGQTFANAKTITLDNTAHLYGLTKVTATSFVGSLTGNADTATKLATARTINGVSFDGSANITVTDSTKLPLTGGTLTGTLTGTAFVYKSTNIDRADTTTDSSVENWVYTYRDKNNNDIGNYGVNRYSKTGQNRHRFRLRNTGNSWADLIFEFKDSGQYFLYMTGSSGTTNGGFSGNITGNAATVTGTAGTSTLAWNSEVTLYTVGGHAIKAKLPANPNTNTDTLMTQAVSTANNRYPLLLCPTATATTDQGAKTGIFAKGVWVNPSTNELIVNANNTFRSVAGNYGAFWRIDTSYFYLMLTASGDQYGSWTSARPILVNLSTGVCNINGNAATATKATQDGSGNTITSTYVAKAGDTMTGVLTVQNSNIKVKDTGITRASSTTAKYPFALQIVDNGNNTLGGVYFTYGTDKATKTHLMCYKGTTTSSSDWSYIGIGYDGSGNVYTYAPNPADSSNTTNIATTKWVKDRLGSYAALSGATFTGKVVMQGYLRSTRADPCVELDVSGYTKGASLSSRTNAGV